MKEMYLNISAHVRFRDGAGGSLHKIAVDPQTNQITDLIILLGFLNRHDHVIPVSHVDQLSPQEITLALTVAETTQYAIYREVDVEERVDDWETEVSHPRERQLFWYPMIGVVERERNVVPIVHRTLSKGIPAEETVIGHAAVVRGLDGVVGKVDYVGLDVEQWVIRDLIVRRGLLPHYYRVPINWVSGITPHEIFLRCGEAAMQEVAMTHLPLELTEVARPPQQGLPVNSHVANADAVAAALANEPLTAAVVIEVVYEHGVVTLTGEVANEAIHAAAERVAHAQPGVLSVVNALEVRAKERNVDAGVVQRLFRPTLKG